MKDVELNVTVKEEDMNMYQRCIRKLLESTFILKSKDEKLYRFISVESNYKAISDYLKIIGFDVELKDKYDICMLVQNKMDPDMIGMRQANAVTFNSIQNYLLLILWKIYLENLGVNEGNFVTKGDLIDRIKSYGVPLSKTDLNMALKLFKKYYLINFADNDNGEDSKIELYPSLQFKWDVSQFLEIIKGYISEKINEDDIGQMCEEGES